MPMPVCSGARAMGGRLPVGVVVLRALDPVGAGRDRRRAGCRPQPVVAGGLADRPAPQDVGMNYSTVSTCLSTEAAARNPRSEGVREISHHTPKDVAHLH